MKKTVIAALFAAGLLTHQVANAWVATEVTQIMNNIQLVLSYATQVEQLTKQAQMLQLKMQDAIKNPEALMRDPKVLGMLASTVEQGESIGMGSARVNSQLSKYFGKDYSQAGQNLSQDYLNWTKVTKDSIRGAMNAVGKVQDGAPDEADQIRRLSQMTSTSSGAMQVAQTGNEIALSMIDQLQKLRSLQMTQMQAQNAAMLAKQERESATAQVFQQVYDGKFIKMDKNSIKNFRDNGGQ